MTTATSYGPQTLAVQTLMARVRRMTSDDARALAAVFNRDAAGRLDAIKVAERMRAGAAARYDAEILFEAVLASSGLSTATARAAMLATGEAAAAIAARDTMTPSAFLTLHGPWALAIR